MTRAVRGLSLRLTAAAATTEPATSRVKHSPVLELELELVLVLGCGYLASHSTVCRTMAEEAPAEVPPPEGNLVSIQ